jgi:hypothetical protein
MLSARREVGCCSGAVAQLEGGGKEVGLLVEPAARHTGGRGDTSDSHRSAGPVELVDHGDRPPSGGVAAVGGGSPEVDGVVGPVHESTSLVSRASRAGMI